MPEVRFKTREGHQLRYSVGLTIQRTEIQMKLPPGFTKKEFQETSDEYLKRLFGIKDIKKADKKGANKEKQRAKPDCACDDVTDRKD